MILARFLLLAAVLVIPLGCSTSQSNWTAPEGHPANPASAAAPQTHSTDPLAAPSQDSSSQGPVAGHDHAAHSVAAPATAAAPAGHDHSVHAAAEDNVEAAGADDQARINQLFASYLQLTASLAADNADEAGKQLVRIHQMGHDLSSAIDPRVASLGDRIGRAAHEPATTLEAMRQRLGGISPVVIELIAIAPPTKAGTPSIREAYCPMVKASWLQSGEAIANPYMGRAMLDCGAVTRNHPITSTPVPTEHIH